MAPSLSPSVGGSSAGRATAPAPWGGSGYARERRGWCSPKGLGRDHALRKCRVRECQQRVDLGTRQEIVARELRSGSPKGERQGSRRSKTMSGTITFEYPMLVLHGNLSRAEPNFDAELDPDVRSSETNAALSILLRVCLQQYDPPGGSGTMRDFDGVAVPVRSWKQSEWLLWTQRYARDVAGFWTG